jgi:hypothetical protein
LTKIWEEEDLGTDRPIWTLVLNPSTSLTMDKLLNTSVLLLLPYKTENVIPIAGLWSGLNEMSCVSFLHGFGSW